jgi:hypothetical protein
MADDNRIVTLSRLVLFEVSLSSWTRRHSKHSRWMYGEKFCVHD